MRIARVFPRRTRATPDDVLAFTTSPPKKGLPDVDEVHISTTFTYDIPKAEQLAKEWERLGVPVRVGGPAYNTPQYFCAKHRRKNGAYNVNQKPFTLYKRAAGPLPVLGGDFVPGLYLRNGYVITSRGCPNRCPHCSVPEREGYALRELPVTTGFNVVDDNLLACSEQHIRKVFYMLSRQSERPIFSGGLEARLLRPWHVELLRKVRTKRMYFAYDDESSYEPLVEAGKLLRDGGITLASQRAACYVLVGYLGDTFDKAETRLRAAWQAGFLPFAMLYRDESGVTDHEWQRFQRLWVRPQIVWSMLKNEKGAIYAEQH